MNKCRHVWLKVTLPLRTDGQDKAMRFVTKVMLLPFCVHLLTSYLLAYIPPIWLSYWTMSLTTAPTWLKWVFAVGIVELWYYLTYTPIVHKWDRVRKEVVKDHIISNSPAGYLLRIQEEFGQNRQ